MKKRKASILKKQNPQRKLKSFGQFLIHYRKAIIAASFVAISTTLLSFIDFTFLSSGFQSTKVDVMWTAKVHIHSPASNAIKKANENEHSRISKLLKKHTRNDGFLDFNNLVKDVYKDTSYEKVHVNRIEGRTVYISLVPRSPIMKVLADKWRLLSKDGVVYGDGVVYEDSDNEKSLVSLTGIFTDQSRFKFHKGNFVVMNDKQKNAIKESLQLYKKLAKHNIIINELNYDYFRGFTIQLSDTNTRVVLGGLENIEDKFSMLSKLLTKFKNENLDISSVELDYKGKAIYKTRSPPEKG